jgi:hypothetical protein
MIAFDRVVCDYPLPEPRDQDREFLTRDLGGFGLDRYTITRDGRLIRQARANRHGFVPVKDVEWPIDGDIRIVDDDAAPGDTSVEYAVRFRQGRVEWIRRVRVEGLEVPPISSPAAGGEVMIPEAMGRPASPEEFWSATPEKLELVDGHIPGEDKLVMILLSTMGLRRVAALVGREAWISAIEDQG